MPFADLKSRGVPTARRELIENIRAVCIERDVRQLELALSCGLDPTALSVRMLGEVAFEPDVIVDVAAALCVPVERLTEGLS
ncbi:hypothetical protein GCM10023221_36490 [Luteimicrobium xylanilyticum]|uniref:HTH cro/C1-type domain-containing protein n=1 Tax=Luteimicrobium xylanilyticum TaxID=1133546 RepID=A0A5P9Q9Z8_9MICO|nr:hypothetical protein [Luteimicrobium xylanilyticum]QFU97892.1 hypothetical protein KDY119_01398 [Luteimicrobium xylanilyticum]